MTVLQLGSEQQYRRVQQGCDGDSANRLAIHWGVSARSNYDGIVESSAMPPRHSVAVSRDQVVFRLEVE